MPTDREEFWDIIGSPIREDTWRGEDTRAASKRWRTNKQFVRDAIKLFHCWVLGSFRWSARVFVLLLFCFVLFRFYFLAVFFFVLKCLDSVRAQKLSLLRISIIKRKTCQPQMWMSSKKIKRDLTVCNLKLLKTSVSSSMVYWKTKRYAMITHQIMIKNQEKLCKNPSVLTWLRTINPSRFALVFRAQSWQ